MTPEHLHLVLNHIPVLGSAFALIPLLTGLFKHNRTCLLTGLAMAMLAGWSTPLVMATGERAYERYEHGSPAAWLDPGAEEILHLHEERAERWSKLLYLSAVLSTVAFLANLRKWPYGEKLATSAALLCAVSLMSGIWIAKSGGQIRRPDFRPNAVQVSHDSHEDHDD